LVIYQESLHGARSTKCKIFATFHLQNVVLAYETQVCGKERFRNKSAKQTRGADPTQARVYIFK